VTRISDTAMTPLVTVQQAAQILGLKSRGSIYRKIRSGDLEIDDGGKGPPMIERSGLEERWQQITREQRNSPTPALRPAAERTQAIPPPKARATAPAEDLADGEVPNFNDERARHEREKRLIAELDRRAKEGELVYRADFVTAQNAVAAQIMNRAEALPRQIKQLIPHLTVEDVEKIGRLVKEMLEGVANWSYEELPEDE
jgi:phage terminase Nu1 subunit (DNA packaging protein)